MKTWMVMSILVALYVFSVIMRAYGFEWIKEDQVLFVGALLAFMKIIDDHVKPPENPAT